MADDYYPPTEDESQQQPQQSQPPEGFVPYRPEIQAQADQPPPNFVPYKPGPPEGFIPHRPVAAEPAPPIKSAPAGATDEERRVIYGDEPLGTPSAAGGLTPRREDTPPILPTNKAGQTLPGYILRALGEGLASIPERLTKSSGELQRQGDVYDPAPAVDLMQTMYGARALAGGLKFRPIPGARPVEAARPRVTPEGQYQLPLEGTHQPGLVRPPIDVEGPLGPRQTELPLGPPVEDALKRQGQTPGSTAAPGVAQEPNPPAAVPVADAQNKTTLGTGAMETGGENLNTRDYGKKAPAATGDATGVNVIKDGVDPTVAHTFKPAEPVTAPVEPPATPRQPAAEPTPAGLLPEKQSFYDAAKAAAPNLPEEQLLHIANLAGGPKGAALMARNTARRMAEDIGAPAARIAEAERAPVPAGTMELPPVEVRPPGVEVPPQAAEAIATSKAAETVAPGFSVQQKSKSRWTVMNEAGEQVSIHGSLADAKRSAANYAKNEAAGRHYSGAERPAPGQQFAPQEQYGGKAPPKVATTERPIEPTGRPVPEGARAEVNKLLDQTMSAANPEAHLRETAARARELGLEGQARRIEAAAAEIERQRTVEVAPGPGERSTGTLRQQQEGIVDRVRSFIADERGGGRLPRTPAEEKILARVAPESSAFSNVPRSAEEASSAWRKFYTNFKNALDPVEQLAKLSDRPVAPEVDPGVLARQTKGIGGRVNQMLENGTYNVKTRQVTGDPLRKVTDKINEDPDGFIAYAIAKHATRLESEGVKTGVPKAEAAAVVAQGGTKWGPVSKELSGYTNRLLDNLVDLVGQKAVDAMKAKYPEHIPFYRLVDPTSDLGQTAGAGLQVRDPIYSIKGSDKQILHPIDSIMKNTMVFTDLAEKNRVMMAMEDFNKTLPPNKQFMREVRDTHPIHVSAAEINKQLGVEGISEQVVDGMKIFRKDAFRPDADRIRVFRDGKAKVYEVPESLGTAVNALDRESLGVLTKILSTPARMLRAGAVLAPEFVAKNPLRDQISAFTQTKYGYLPVYDFAVGLKNLFPSGGKHSELFQRWQIEGGANANLVSMDRRVMNMEPRTMLQHVANVVTTPYQWLQMASEVMENATRLGVTSRALKRGAHPIEAVFEAREGTLDFQRVGAAGVQKSLNSLIPFYNASLEGTDRMLRAFRDRPVDTTIRTGAAITLPSVMLWAATKDDERIQQLPRWRKDVAWNIPGRDNWVPISTQGRNEILDGMGLRAEGLDLSKLTHTFRKMPDGSFQYNNAIIWAIPKPPGIGQLFGSIPERILDAYVQHDPTAYKELGKTIWQAFSPSIVPQVVSPMLEQWANKSFFLDRTLVSPSLQKLPPSQQVSPQTSEVAKDIAGVIRKVAGDVASPIIVDNYIRAWTGGLGKHVTDLLDMGLRDKDAPTRPSWTAADMPLVKAFVARYPSADAQAIQQFYDTYEERKTAAAGIKNLQKTGQPADPSLLRENPVQGIHNALGTGFKTVRNIMGDKNMSADDKRAALDLTYLFMIEKAKQGNAALEQSKRKQEPPPGFIPYQPGAQ